LKSLPLVRYSTRVESSPGVIQTVQTLQHPLILTVGPAPVGERLQVSSRLAAKQSLGGHGDHHPPIDGEARRLGDGVGVPAVGGIERLRGRVRAAEGGRHHRHVGPGVWASTAASSRSEGCRCGRTVLRIERENLADLDVWMVGVTRGGEDAGAGVALCGDPRDSALPRAGG
jgi:hypothetical protein